MNCTLSLLLSALLLSGCATSPVGISQLRTVPQSKIKGTPARAVSSITDGGRVIVVRDTVLLGGGGGLRLLIDGVPVADLATFDRYEVILAEGEYVLGLLPSVNLFSASTVKETGVFVHRGQTYTFRVGLDVNGLFINARRCLVGRAAFSILVFGVPPRHSRLFAAGVFCYNRSLPPADGKG